MHGQPLTSQRCASTRSRARATVVWALLSGAAWLCALPTAVRADSLGNEQHTDISGVQLWLPDEQGEERDVEQNNAFVGHCNGRRSVHVAGLQRTMTCLARRMDDGSFRIRLNAQGRTLPWPALVSLQPLPARVRADPLNDAERTALDVAERGLAAKLAQAARADFFKSYGTSVGDYTELLAAVKTEPAYRAGAGQRWKLRVADSVYFISALGLRPGPLGWDFVNVVFRAEGGALKRVGSFDGCIKGFRDLNGDGLPEVYVETCRNDEGSAYTYWSLRPALKAVLGH